MRTAISSFLVAAAVIMTTACGTSSPASPSAIMLHGDSHRGGSSGSGDTGSTVNGSDDGATHDIEINGLVTAVGADSVTVGTQKIAVTKTTRIENDGQTLALADIKIGDRVEVKATMSGTTLTATRIQVEREEADSGDDR